MHINLYDFDGVLADPFEEALFTLPQTRHDSEFVAAVCEDMELDLSTESLKSQRYICMQALMLQHDIGMLPGPILPQMAGPCYILTARCDVFAVARMHEFLADDNCPAQPIKTMHLDHLPKGQMIEVLLERHPDCTFSFWDDNPKHITSARMLRSPRLEVFHVDNDMNDAYKDAESFYKETLLELAL